VIAETFAVLSVLSFLAGMRCHGLYKYKQQVALSYSLQGVNHDGIYDEVSWYNSARQILFLSTVVFGVCSVVSLFVTGIP